jgi:hypothetical protein
VKVQDACGETSKVIIKNTAGGWRNGELLCGNGNGIWGYCSNINGSVLKIVKYSPGNHAGCNGEWCGSPPCGEPDTCCQMIEEVGGNCPDSFCYVVWSPPNGGSKCSPMSSIASNFGIWQYIWGCP